MENKEEYLRVAFVKGSEGYCMLITGEDGNGYRVAGPKAWNNPTNIPTAEFEISVEDLIWAIENNKYGDKNENN